MIAPLAVLHSFVSETGLPQVALMSFLLLPLLLNPDHLPLPTCDSCSMLNHMWKHAELTSVKAYKWELHLNSTSAFEILWKDQAWTPAGGL